MNGMSKEYLSVVEGELDSNLKRVVYDFLTREINDPSGNFSSFEEEVEFISNGTSCLPIWFDEQIRAMAEVIKRDGIEAINPGGVR